MGKLHEFLLHECIKKRGGDKISPPLLMVCFDINNRRFVSIFRLQYLSDFVV